MFWSIPCKVTITTEEKKVKPHEELKLNDPSFIANCYACGTNLKYFQYHPNSYMECNCCDHKFCVPCDEAIDEYLGDKNVYSGFEADVFFYCPCYLINGYNKNDHPKCKKCISGKEIYDLIYPNKN
jgi:hypothetical protein